MSGWGRTGQWFAVDNWGIKPDILTTAKGITSAYVPLGLTATSMKIADFFDDHYFAHGHTYEAHPLTLAPAIAAIKEFKRLDLIKQAAEKGIYLKEKLEELRTRHPSIGDVRGIGLFWAVEIVKNEESKLPFNTKEDKIKGSQLMVDKVTSEMMKHGVYMQGWISHFVIAPPLIISEDQIDLAIEVLDSALTIVDSELS